MPMFTSEFCSCAAGFAPLFAYDDPFNIEGLQQLNVRRQKLTEKLFHKIVSNDSHRLHSSVPLRHLNDLNEK
jgi:hypothetical protein